MLVDDDPSMRGLLQLLLEIDGEFTVVGQADDGRTVIDLVAAENPDVVVVDMRLPMARGEQLVHELRDRRVGGAGPAIVGYSAESDRLAVAAAAGADATVSKDEPLETLIAALRRVTDVGG